MLASSGEEQISIAQILQKCIIQKKKMLSFFQVMLEPALTYAILGVWSLSLLQFCLVLGAGHRGRKER
jgi:hypothetical protein